MKVEYEINAAYFENNNFEEDGELYVLTNTGEIDPTKKTRYASLHDVNTIRTADLSKYTTVTVYQWVDDEINMFYEYK